MFLRFVKNLWTTNEEMRAARAASHLASMVEQGVAPCRSCCRIGVGCQVHGLPRDEHRRGSWCRNSSHVLMVNQGIISDFLKQYSITINMRSLIWWGGLIKLFLSFAHGSPQDQNQKFFHHFKSFTNSFPIDSVHSKCGHYWSYLYLEDKFRVTMLYE